MNEHRIRRMRRTAAAIALSAAVPLLLGAGAGAAPPKVRFSAPPSGAGFKVTAWKVQATASYSASGAGWTERGTGTWEETLNHTASLKRERDGALVFYGKSGGGAIAFPVVMTYATHCTRKVGITVDKRDESHTLKTGSAIEVNGVGNGRAVIEWSLASGAGCLPATADTPNAFKSSVQIAELTSPKVVRLHASGQVPIGRPAKGTFTWQATLTMKRMPTLYGG